VVLERLAQVTDVFFDKTGTLTQGSFRLVEVLSGFDTHANGNGGDGRSPLQVAASLESRAEHPVAAALRNGAAASGLAELPVSAWRAEPGLGVRGRVAGSETEYVLGSRRLMEHAGFQLAPGLAEAAARRGENGETVVYLGSGGRVRAAFAVGEEARAEAGNAVSALRRLGARLAILSGDERGSAERLGAALGIGDVRWGLLPHEKVAAVQAAGDRLASSRVAMVGDGINDAAGLAAAHVGIAMGCGADVTREAADVAMVGGDLMQIPWLLRFSRQVRRTVATNLVWSFAYNTAGIGLALTGWLPPVLAAVAMVLSSLFVIGNTRRLSQSVAAA
jgi:Cu+-exporting ATPase